METLNKFSCVIIGSGTLPILCAEFLLSNDHEICNIISSDPEVKRWSTERKIPYLEPSANLTELLSCERFDYLFSINNEHILDEEVLKLPRMAVNYHDSLLPGYAGSHATSWALMNGEAVHGVTWHLMTKIVDAGDILKQESVQIGRDDTAFTLNMKCYEAAINTFTQLVSELAAGNVVTKKQNLAARTFCARYKRPANGSVISWHQCASDIDAFVRALNFDSHANPLGSPKLSVGNSFFIVPEMEVLSEPSHASPGTITRIGTDFLHVATADREVKLHRLLTLGGEPIPMPELVARFDLRPGYIFPDLDRELAKRLQSLYEASSRHEAFWIERLASLEPATLPYRKSATSAQVPDRSSLPLSIPDAVFSFIEERQWTISDFLLASYGAFIARVGEVHRFDIAYSDCDLKSQFTGLDQLFAIHLPVRLEIDWSQSFTKNFAAVKHQLESVRKHSSYTHDVVLRYPELRSVRESGGKFTLPVAVEKVERVADGDVPSGSEIVLKISEPALESRWIYNRNKLDDASAARLSSHFATFLSAIVSSPEQPVASLPLSTVEEQHEVLVEWNDNHAYYPKDRCIHELFEEQAARTPDVVALIFGGRHLTYLELNRRANKLAHFLRSLGASAEVPVGICVDRSLEMVIALLAVLKAGAAYLPLDPAYPQERLAFMLRDSQAPVLLTQQSLAFGFRQQATRIVCLDTDWKMIAKHSEQNPVSEVTPENLAYIIYTSGSTGRPKGVLISHSALVSHSVNVIRHYELDPSDRVLQFSSISFDVAAEELLPTLLSGAALILPTWQALPSVSDFVALVENECLTVVNLPSSYWHELVLELDHSRRRLSPTLRLVITGSDKVLPERLATWRRMFGNSIRWLNAYGPTEATVTTTIYDPDAAEEVHETLAVPIGRPLANRQVYILDSHLKPVPVGVPGELCIGGAGLARGYLNSPGITAEKFIRNPFSPDAGARLYRTGDRARYLADGNIEFIGRADRQVKVRGFRIELDEIENVLVQHPSIRACAVVAREEEAGDIRLVAHLAPAVDHPHTGDQSPATNGQKLLPMVHRFLQERLPDYMLPSAFVMIDEVSLLPNGKVNREALTLADLSRREPERAVVSALDSVELQLTEIWQRVLGLQTIGVNDDFFQLGGHSLQAVRMFAEVEKAFSKNIPLGTLFQAGTIRKLADILRQNGWSAPESPLVAVQPNGSQPPFFCIHPLGGDVLLYRDLARHLGPDQPFYGLRAARFNGKQAGHRTVEGMAEHYLKEIQTVQPQGPYLLGGLSFGGVIAFEMAQQLCARGHKVALLTLFDAELFPITFRSRIHRLRRRVQLHRDRLMMLDSRAKVEYVRSKVAKIGRDLFNKLQNQYRKASRKFDLVFRPPAGKYFQVEDEIWRAGQRYVPRLYPGRITLFRADQSLGIYPDPMLGWQGLAMDGLEIHEISGSSHDSIVLEPHVETVANELRRCIENALIETEQANPLTQPSAVDRIGMHLSLCLTMSSMLQ